MKTWTSSFGLSSHYQETLLPLVRKSGYVRSKQRPGREPADTHARNRRQKPVRQRIRQGAEPDRGQDLDPVAPQHLSQGHEALVLAHQGLDVAAQHPAAGDEGGGAPHDGGRGGDGPAAREAVHEAREGDGGAVPDYGREAGQADEEEDYQGARVVGELAPGLGEGPEVGVDRVGVDGGCDAEREEDGCAETDEDAV